MSLYAKLNRLLLVLSVALTGWLIPGGGYFLIKQYKRSLIILVTIGFTFAVGLYVGSIGVIDPSGQRLWFYAQILVSPGVVAISKITSTGLYPVHGRAGEMGQIYTGIAGLLNLLCVVNSAYLAFIHELGEKN